MLSDEQREEVKRSLAYGISEVDIAEDFGISTRTVRRIKKELSEEAPARQAQDISADNSDDLLIKSSTVASKKELSFIKKYNDEIELYEDHEEGWVFHITAHDYRLSQSGRAWIGIFYPESSNIDDVVSKLTRLGVAFAISPCHDKDVWTHDSPEQVDAKTGEHYEKGELYKAGDKKKAHYHLIVVFDKRISAREVNNIIRSITNGPYLQKCHSLKNSYDYFLHLNDPEKYQFYDKDEIIRGNDFHIEPTNYEKGMMISEIVDLILDKEIDSWSILMRECTEVEYRNLITARPGAFTRLVQENWSKHNPDGKVHRMRIVNNDEEK